MNLLAAIAVLTPWIAVFSLSWFAADRMLIGIYDYGYGRTTALCLLVGGAGSGPKMALGLRSVRCMPVPKGYFHTRVAAAHVHI